MIVRICLFVLLICGAALAAEDPAITLGRILAGKGAISASDLAAVTASADRVGALAAVLREKGLLNDAEVAQFRAAPAPTIHAAAPRPPAPAQTAAPPPPERPAVTF